MIKEDILKHREVFNKWLDGEQIQFYYESEKTWIDTNNPNWYIDTKYRVKPTKIEIEDCHFNEIEYKVDKIGKVVEVRVDRLKININRTKSTLFKDKEIAEAYAVLPKLIRLRDEYNEGWKPDWLNTIEKYTIFNLVNKIHTSFVCNENKILSFKTAEIRNKFLKDHRDLIEIAKPLL